MLNDLTHDHCVTTEWPGIEPLLIIFVHFQIIGKFDLQLILYLFYADFVGVLNHLVLLLGLDQHSALKEEV